MSQRERRVLQRRQPRSALGYNLTEGWGQGERSTEAHFQPIETFPERFEAMIRDVRGLGFEAMNLWIHHLHPSWSAEHHTIARGLLDQYGVRVPSLVR